MAVHFVRAAPQQHQSAARPETVHSTHNHHRPYWLSLIFLIFNYQSPTSCTMFVQSPGKSCVTTYIITESGRVNRFLPAPPACCPEFVQSQSHATEVRTEISGVSLRHTATYICHTAIQGWYHTQSPNIIHCPEEMEEVKSLVFSSAASSLSPHIKTDIVTLPLMYVNETLSAASPVYQFSSSH